VADRWQAAMARSNFPEVGGAMKDDRESKIPQDPLDEPVPRESSAESALRRIMPDVERQLATAEASARLAVESILHDLKVSQTMYAREFLRDLNVSQALYAREFLHDLNISQALYAREILAGLHIPQLNVDAALFRSILAPASSILEEAFAPLAQAQLAVATQLQEQMSDWMQSFYAAYEHVFKPLEGLAERIGEKDKIKKAFESAKLWLAPSMPRQLISRVLKLHQGGASPGVIASAVSRFYARAEWDPLARAVGRWGSNPLFQGRMKVFRHALDAHRNKWFTLTVPTLVPQIEGICGQYVKRRRLLPKLIGKTKKVVQTALQYAPCSLGDVERYAAIDGVLTFIERHFYMVEDFETEYESLLREKDLRAHAIRHGHQERYDTRMNSLRLFLLLDVLSLLE
jgi:hypothetical protein